MRVILLCNCGEVCVVFFFFLPFPYANEVILVFVSLNAKL
jgi:hypothetical protein